MVVPTCGWCMVGMILIGGGSEQWVWSVVVPLKIWTRS